MNSRTHLPALALLALFSAGSAFAQSTLALYSFGVSGSTTFASTDVNADTTASAITVSSGFGTLGTANGGHLLSTTTITGLSGAMLYISNNAMDTLSETAAVGANDYFQFSLTLGNPVENQVSLSNLSFKLTLTRPGTAGSAPDNTETLARSGTVFLRSSLDNYASTLGTATVTGAKVTTQAVVGTFNFDLSSLSSITGVTFRMYAYDNIGTLSGTNQNDPSGAGLRIDDITLSGTVSAIPEPSAFAALAGLGVLGLAAYRRRRTR